MAEPVLRSKVVDVLANPWFSMLFGPNKLNKTGRKSKPWNSPNTTTRKKVRKMIYLDIERRTNARKVEIPPCRTAGPMLVRVCFILSSLEPLATVHEGVGNVSEYSAQSPIEMVIKMARRVPMFSPQKLA